MMDRVGQQLGNYRLTRLLGTGSFSDVYQGEHTLLMTKVAIKVLHTEVTQGDVAQFQQEARLLASLRHPHIIRVLDFGLDDETPYLVMDYAPHGTLRTRHTKGTPLPVSTVVSYVKQVAEALQYAHDRKIVHRDVKPENMLVGEKNEILLGDFGIALITQGTRFQTTQDVTGTLPYMSPEQIQGKPRPASDQYSLGIVVYEWLNGMYPFQGSLTELCTQHMFASPSPLRERVPSIPPEVEHVVTIALAKDPKERFESVLAFATALEQASQGIPVTRGSYAMRSSSLSDTLPSSPLGTFPSLHSDRLLTLPAKAPTSQPQQPLESSSASVMESDHLILLPESVLQTLSTSPISEKIPGKPRVRLSRRSVLIGVACVAAIAAAGFDILVVAHQQSKQTQAVPMPTSSAQTPTVIPQNQLFTYRGHSSAVWSVAWSPDSKRIVSGSNDRTVQVWNAGDGGDSFTYRGHLSSVDVVTWSPDGQFIASGSDDGTVQVCNASNMSTVLIYPGHTSNVNALAWSPNGQLIASGSVDRTVQVWNANVGSVVFIYSGHADMLWGVTWSPDGERVASCSEDGTVQVWNADGGGDVFTYRGHTDVVFGVAWSPDGARIASCSADQTVQVWDAKGGGNVFTYLGHSGTVRGVTWSPDGKQIASCSEDGAVQVWNVSNGSKVFTYKGHSDWVLTVAWSSDGKRIVSGSRDSTVQVWRPV